MPRLRELEMIHVRMPLVAPFRTSFGVETERDVLLLHAVTDDAEGWAECVAMEEPLYSSEYVSGAHAVIKDHLLPRMFKAAEVAAEEIGPLLAPISGHRMAKAALETALLDAQLKAEGRSLGQYLGAVRETVDCGVSVGIFDRNEELLAAVAGYLAEGYKRIKLKIEPGRDVDAVTAVRERFGGDVLLQVDANTAYTLDDAAHLAHLDDCDLLLIEQPLPEEEVLAHAKLAKLIRTPVCLDESIVSCQVAADAIELGACAIVNIKPGRVGGYLESRRIHDLCAERGIPVWCGGMLETGIGRAANVALAALPNFTLPGDTSGSSRYYKQDLTPPFVLEDGQLRVPTAPGIGVEVLREVVDALTTSREVVSA